MLALIFITFHASIVDHKQLGVLIGFMQSDINCISEKSGLFFEAELLSWRHELIRA